ncbi:MAG: peptidoglycan-binding protein LysM [Paracoccus sp. (in: a-proteobacteria)]|nr:peptidoglycan-binding protein LysM [Paracoccus sp. (in: a-proteobacteria)]
MAFWDFVKDAGKSVLGKAEAAPAPEPTPEKTADELETERKVKALTDEVKKLGLTSKDVHLTLRGDLVRVESKGADRETMEKLILALGNIQGIARVEAELPELTGHVSTSGGAGDGAPVFHTVKKGETLSAIAKEYLGSANRYNDIFKANQPMLSHPDKIYPGQTLRIPQ